MNFICPICGCPLIKNNNSLICEKSHSFDIAKEGYVNLLVPGKTNSKNPGDNKEMVLARRSFLENGHYLKLREALCEIIAKYKSALPEGDFVDFGSGEGYYTERCADEFLSGKNGACFGVDISKEAVKLAAKRHGKVNYAVASVYSMPIAENSASLALNVFSPLALDEISRILKKDGLFVYVVPSSKHLWEIKSTVYESPYLNEETDTEYDGFEHLETLKLRYTSLMRASDIWACFSMTPYYWRSPKVGTERLKTLESLECSIGFDVLVYRKR